MCSTNIRNRKASSQQEFNQSDYTTLDKSVQPVTFSPKDLEKRSLEDREKLHKHAKSKAYSIALAIPLLNVTKDNKKMYLRVFDCATTALRNGKKLTYDRYCNSRICFRCNKIRTAKLIDGYTEAFEQMKDPYSVTLTDVNVKGSYLSKEIEAYNSDFLKFRRNYKKKTGKSVSGIRKLEITYNVKDNTYHPHAHIIVDGKEEAFALRYAWLKRRPSADIRCNHIVKADKGTLKELFKYMTKLIGNEETDYKALDHIITVTKGKRIVQPFGEFRKIAPAISEDVDDRDAQNYSCLSEDGHEIYTYERKAYDWVSNYGECLTEYIPSDLDRLYLDGNQKKFIEERNRISVSYKNTKQ